MTNLLFLGAGITIGYILCNGRHKTKAAEERIEALRRAASKGAA